MSQTEGLDTAPIENEVTVGVSATQSLTVVDAATYAAAGEHLKGFAALKKRIEEYFESDVKHAHTLWSSLTGKRKKALDAVDAEITRIKRQMGAWSQEQDRLRRDEERRVALAAQRAEQARLAAEAELLELQGHKEMAEAVYEQAVSTPAPMVQLPTAVPKVSGLSTVEAWSFTIINPALLPREYLQPNEKAIRAKVADLKGMARIPGVHVFREDQVRVRSAS